VYRAGCGSRGPAESISAARFALRYSMAARWETCAFAPAVPVISTF
jgi:hypothetical protein